MVTYEDISTWLSASAANASSNGKGNNLVTHNGEALFLQKWDEAGLSEKILVANSVKDSAALISDNKLFAVGTDDSLKHFVKSNDDSGSEWSEKHLGNVSVKVHPDTQLCVFEDGSTTVIFHQDTRGALAILQGNGNEWKTTSFPASNPQIGTAMAFFPFNGKDHLFYITEDERLHRLVRGAEDADWKDVQFSNAKFDDEVSKIVVIPGEEDGQSVLNVFGLKGNKLVLVTESTTDPVIIGQVRNGTFSLAKCAFAEKVICGLVGQVAGGIFGGGAAGGGGFGGGLFGGGGAGAGCVGAGHTNNNFEFVMFQGVHNQRFQ